MATNSTNPKLGAYMKAARMRAELTQEEAAKHAGLKQSYIASLESGRFQIIYPGPFNALHRLYRFAGWVALDAMGYETDGAVDRIIPPLLTYIQRMEEPEQEALLGVAKAMAKGR
jgi:transcriptional regulator with XRE-family HTH domain